MYNGKSDNKERSVLFNSPLHSCITNHDGDLISDCLDVFENEASALLSLAPYDKEEQATRFEMLRPMILKVLLYLGFKPLGEKFAVIMRLIELLTVDGDFDRAITNCASSCGNEDIVIRAIESEIDMYDAEFVNKLSLLTDTSPLSPRDALFDIAIYIRNERLCKNKYNA
ncbi:MAG: hypothetical protein J1G04_05005 [Clostridiales bacterium]|nr:hypothetical protein [Clostridiales bacterium]